MNQLQLILSLPRTITIDSNHPRTKKCLESHSHSRTFDIKCSFVPIKTSHGTVGTVGSQHRRIASSVGAALAILISVSCGRTYTGDEINGVVGTRWLVSETSFLGFATILESRQHNAFSGKHTINKYFTSCMNRQY